VYIAYLAPRGPGQPDVESWSDSGPVEVPGRGIFCGSLTPTPPRTYKSPQVMYGRSRLPPPMDFHPAMSKQLPPELVDEVVGNLNNPRDLRTCSLVSSNWLEGSRRKLFANVSLNTWNFDQWQKNITPGPNGISAYVRSLTLRQARSIVSLEPETLMGIMDHLTSFRRLNALFLQDVSFDDFFDGLSLTQCFGHFGVSVESLHLHGIMTDKSTMLLFINLFPNLGNLTISSPILSGGETEVPKGALPLQGTLRLSGLGAASSTLLRGIALFPLRLEGLSVTHSQIADPGDLNRLIEACAPTLKRVELAHLTSGTFYILFPYRTTPLNVVYQTTKKTPFPLIFPPAVLLGSSRPTPWRSNDRARG